jgi:hypothetical protein
MAAVVAVITMDYGASRRTNPVTDHSIGVTTARPSTGATTGRRSIGVTTGRPDHKFGLVQTEMSRDTPPPNPAFKT